MLKYFAMAPMDPCDNRDMDQERIGSKFINMMKTAVNNNSSSIFHIMEARSIPTYDKLKDDEYGNNVSFMVRMDDDAWRGTSTNAQEDCASLSWDEKRDVKSFLSIETVMTKDQDTHVQVNVMHIGKLTED